MWTDPVWRIQVLKVPICLLDLRLKTSKFIYLGFHFPLASQLAPSFFSPIILHIKINKR